VNLLCQMALVIEEFIRSACYTGATSGIQCTTLAKSDTLTERQNWRIQKFRTSARRAGRQAGMAKA
jgi:hypothetical protein